MELMIGMLCFALGGAAVWWLTKGERDRLRAETQTQRQQLLESHGELAAVRADNKGLKELETRLRENFENVANRTLSENSVKLSQQHEQLLAPLLQPLKQKLEEFRREVNDAYGKESRERFALQKEIERLAALNQQVSLEANSLTQALQGDSKVQGDWGEIQLDLILERAGLREGFEFTKQGDGLGLKNDEGRVQRPDVVVHLPDKKHLIIDSKVSLKAYHQYIQASGGGAKGDTARPQEAQAHLAAHVASVRGHIDDLSGKDYQSLAGLDAPDMMLLFMPIESALSEALKHDPTLTQYAWSRKISVVSPTLLFTFLRTIATLWGRDRQTKNALIIADEGGKLYDKFVGFVTDLETIGKRLEDAQESYRDSMDKLRSGKGNLIGRVEKLRDLGVKTKKQLADNSHESADETPALPAEPR